MGVINGTRVPDYTTVKNISLDLGQLTVFVGGSGSGKTSILRLIDTAFNYKGHWVGDEEGIHHIHSLRADDIHECIPNLNMRKPYLSSSERWLFSVFYATYKDTELILIDDVAPIDRESWFHLFRNVILPASQNKRIVISTQRMDYAQVAQPEDIRIVKRTGDTTTVTRYNTGPKSILALPDHL